MNTKLQGSWGEALALDYLKGKKYIPVAMGYRSRYGEIDVIVKNASFVVFAEVKVRKNDKFAEAREFVDKNKQSRLRKTAQIWLIQHETTLQPRFDVIEVYAPLGTDTVKPTIIHIENAF
jgi:putative endonuclease